MGLISGRPSPTEGQPPCSPPPLESQRAELCLPRTAVGGWGVEAHTGHSHPLPSSLSRLLNTQRPQGTGSQSICKDPLPEGGPRMYCLPRLIVNAIPEDSSMVGFGAQNGTP